MPSPARLLLFCLRPSRWGDSLMHASYAWKMMGAAATVKIDLARDQPYLLPRGSNRTYCLVGA